jgi:hypothetical protein
MKYASFLVISRALHLNVFDQRVKKTLFQQPDSSWHRQGGAVVVLMNTWRSAEAT